MRHIAPQRFDAAEFFDGVYTFQEWELFPGHNTKGPKIAKPNERSSHFRRLFAKGLS